MAAGFTLTELSAAIQAFTWCDEPNFVSNIPIIIRDSEDEIVDSLRKRVELAMPTYGNPAIGFPQFAKRASLAITASTQTVDLPSDCLLIYSFTITGGVISTTTPIFPRVYSYLEQAYPSSLGVGRPKVYANANSLIYFGPTPDLDYTGDINYFYKPESLVDATVGTYTWLSLNASGCLLDTCLARSYALFLRGEKDKAASYRESADKKLSLIKEQPI